MDKQEQAWGQLEQTIWAMDPAAWPLVSGRLTIAVEIDDPAPELSTDYYDSQAVLPTWAISPAAARLGLPKVKGSVAVVPIVGVIDRARNWMGDVFTEELGALMSRLMADSQVGAVVLDFDSPGGSVAGVPELAETLRGYRDGDKPIYAVASESMASAAYWLGTQATRVYAAPSAQVGSIGVWTAHVDLSQAMEDSGWKITLVSAGKYKVEGNPWEPLSEDAKNAMLGEVTAYYEMFVEAVAKGRNTKPATVRKGFGEGRMLMAGPALANSMIDGIATLGDVVTALLPTRRGSTLATAKALIALEEADEL